MVFVWCSVFKPCACVLEQKKDWHPTAAQPGACGASMLDTAHATHTPLHNPLVNMTRTQHTLCLDADSCVRSPKANAIPKSGMTLVMLKPCVAAQNADPENAARKQRSGPQIHAPNPVMAKPLAPTPPAAPRLKRHTNSDKRASHQQCLLAWMHSECKSVSPAAPPAMHASMRPKTALPLPFRESLVHDLRWRHLKRRRRCTC